MGSAVFNELVTKLGIPTSVSFPYWIPKFSVVTYFPTPVPVPVFKGFKTLIWIRHKLRHESEIPFPTMFITCSLLLLILKLKEYQHYLVTGRMFIPVNKTFNTGPLYFIAPFHIQLMKMCKRKRCQITVKLSRGGCYTNL